MIVQVSLMHDILHLRKTILIIFQTTKKDEIKEYSLGRGLTKVRLLPHRILSTLEFLRLCGLVLGKKKSVALLLCFYTVKMLYIKKHYSEREWLHWLVGEQELFHSQDH